MQNKTSSINVQHKTRANIKEIDRIKPRGSLKDNLKS